MKNFCCFLKLLTKCWSYFLLLWFFSSNNTTTENKRITETKIRLLYRRSFEKSRRYSNDDRNLYTIMSWKWCSRRIKKVRVVVYLLSRLYFHFWPAKEKISTIKKNPQKVIITRTWEGEFIIFGFAANFIYFPFNSVSLQYLVWKACQKLYNQHFTIVVGYSDNMYHIVNTNSISLIHIDHAAFLSINFISSIPLS